MGKRSKPKPPPPSHEAIVGKWDINPDTGCWEWNAVLDRHGYGQISNKGWPFKAHRVTYEHFIGPIPVGLELDHLCRNKRCVNPAHLEAVTHAENLRRGMAPNMVIVRTNTCPKGHDLAVYARPRKSGGRQCGECGRIRTLARYYRLKAEGIDPNANRKRKSG